jgi:hypothetical protein
VRLCLLPRLASNRVGHELGLKMRARAMYQIGVNEYPGRLIMLCDGARILSRSDRRDTTR